MPYKNKQRRKTFYCWWNMMERCTRESHPSYHHYGGRGIGVCESWSRGFKHFLADMGDKPDGLEIERKDNNLGYSPENCKWATRLEQTNNMRTTTMVEVGGVTMSACNLARKYKVPVVTLKHRIFKMGIPPDEAAAMMPFDCVRNRPKTPKPQIEP